MEKCLRKFKNCSKDVFKKQIEQLEAESRAESGAEQTQNGQMPRGIMLCASSTRASDEGTDAASGADLQRALSSRGTELAAAPGPEDGKMAQADEGASGQGGDSRDDQEQACWSMGWPRCLYKLWERCF